MKNRFETIDQYLATVPDHVRPILQKIRETIHKAVPDATEAISYQIPTFKLNGNLIHFAAYRSHIGIYPVPEGTQAFNRELAPYVTGKGTIQFPLDRTVPYQLIRKIVLARVAEIREK